MPLVDVATPAALIEAIANAQPGDEIVLADGEYLLTDDVACRTAGTESAPITVRSANRRAAKIRFDTTEGFKVTASYWTFSGLDITGACASDSDCEHAFHVMGAAHHFTLRDSAVRDFNAQLKANATPVNGTMTAPDDGLVEGNDIGDTRGRDTSYPVTKLNIDTGARWIVRGNYLHDAQKLGGNQISYLAFMKSGGTNGLYERNLALCAATTTGGTRIGLSFGGGGTGAEFCAPAYSASVPCSVEHQGGVMRNNVIASCSDVGIYINRGAATQLLYNTLVATAGIDARYDTTTGTVAGNLMAGAIRNRDGAAISIDTNRQGISEADFASWYRAPLEGDLTVVGDVSSFVGAGPPLAAVPDDYCGRARGTQPYTFGAVEHSLGPCEESTSPNPDGGVAGDAGTTPPDGDSEGSGCCDAGAPGASSGALALLVALALTGRSARTRTAPRRPAR